MNPKVYFYNTKEDVKNLGVGNIAIVVGSREIGFSIGTEIFWIKAETAVTTSTNSVEKSQPP